MAVSGFGLNPIAVQEGLVNNFIAEGLALSGIRPIAPQPVAPQPIFAQPPPPPTIGPIDAQVDFSPTAQMMLEGQAVEGGGRGKGKGKKGGNGFKNHGQMVSAAARSGVRGQDLAAIARGEEQFQPGGGGGPMQLGGQETAFLQRKGHRFG